jgi:predicted RNA-binding Zn-ribbon protein involved in translation (DUF1610 family)
VGSVHRDGLARFFGRLFSRFGAALVWVICLFDHGTVWGGWETEVNSMSTSGVGGIQHTCPHCGSATVRRSHRRGVVDRILQVVRFRPYRCQECYNRFFRIPRKDADDQIHDSTAHISTTL